MIPSLLMALFSAFEGRRANHILELHPATGPPLSSQGAAGGFYVLRELWGRKRKNYWRVTCLALWVRVVTHTTLQGHEWRLKGG